MLTKQNSIVLSLCVLLLLHTNIEAKSNNIPTVTKNDSSNQDDKKNESELTPWNAIEAKPVSRDKREKYRLERIRQIKESEHYNRIKQRLEKKHQLQIKNISNLKISTKAINEK